MILRDKETTLEIMGKRLKMDNRKWVEAVYDDIAKVVQRTPVDFLLRGCDRLFL